ncbi:argininosuccinate lyase [Weeksellaceae bacterium KMM 9713]|uniref:Argininosuccinate lyase n=1 Tax=Profundicola chukchiensis TaxID=2961959 RepID=A0A9X4RUP7_9FLAO|nr:argininosuccinate lyase [Profundicola chukchiensis]MDG4946333.1 argininosuccinate lyase [Profundicola chukchiensis]
MKLWDKGFTVDKKIENFTIGKDRILDIYIAKHDMLASKAQANMLAKVGLLSDEENEQLQKGLDQLLLDLENGNFEIDEHFEDVHSKIESELIKLTGDAGKKIHVARSRNDQVLVALQLFQKEYLEDVTNKVLELVNIMLKKAEEHKNDLLPGYTHFQAAMPNSFGMWFTAYAENLLSDLAFFKAAYHVADQNPLGSGAGFGTSFPIDRLQTTKELGFSELAVSSVGAQMLRGKTEKAVASALAMISGTLSKLSYDLVMYNSQDLGFVKLPNEMTTGSSIMPHKKNPDVFELTRAHCNRIQGVPNDIALIINNLPSGYHRDFQILKEVLFEPMMQFVDILDILIFALPQLEIKSGYMDQEKYDGIYTVENINYLIQNGTAFRDAYKEVGLSVEDGSYVPHKEFKTSHIGSIHNLGIDLIQDKVKRFKLVEDK